VSAWMLTPMPIRFTAAYNDHSGFCSRARKPAASPSHAGRSGTSIRAGMPQPSRRFRADIDLWRFTKTGTTKLPANYQDVQITAVVDTACVARR
jgi:hypothetical protein